MDKGLEQSPISPTLLGPGHGEPEQLMSPVMTSGSEDSSYSESELDNHEEWIHPTAMSDLYLKEDSATRVLGLGPRRDPRGNSDRRMSLTRVDHHHENHCSRVLTIKDIEKSISLAREALELCPHSHRDRSKYLNSLAVALATRYEQLGEMENLNEAIALERAALDLRPVGHRDRSKSLNNLALDLCSRFKKSGERADLDMAIVLAQEALVLCPHGHPDRPTCLHNLAADLFMRFKQLRNPADLDRAIVLGQEALQLQPRGHPGRTQSLNDAIDYISIRYEWFGDSQDLDDIITLTREVADLYPREHPDRPFYLLVVACNLSARYGQYNRMTDLEDTIILEEEALHLFPQSHHLWSSTLNDLASHLSTRYYQLREMADLDKVIVLEREALGHSPRRDPDRSSFLNSLAAHLFTRYCCLSTITDLNEAVFISREAFNLCPSGHPDWSMALNDLAHYLVTRFTRLHQPRDQEDLFNIYAELMHRRHIPDLSAAKGWVNASETFNHPTILLAYETCLRLFVHRRLATLHSYLLNVPDIEQFMASLAVNAFSACLRNNQPGKAVEFLEQGRCVFWNQIAPLYFHHGDIIASDTTKTLADELAHLSSLLHNAINSPASPDYHDLHHLDHEMERVVDNIRNLPDFHRFLLPLSFPDLQRAASCGPVIIVSASQYGCDALVVFADRYPVHIPLKITRERVRDLLWEFWPKSSYPGRNLGDILRVIWDEVVLPIVNVLEVILPAGSRIWWSPTAEFTRLPLHAAGPYRTGQRNLSDIYVSSYTSSLTALIRDRRPLSTSVAKKKRFLAIDGPQFRTYKTAPAGRELDNVGQKISPFTTFTRLDGPGSSISRVYEELTWNDWIHLVCHTLPVYEWEQFKSAFVLHDRNLTVRNIMGCKWTNAEFAYLSASLTTFRDSACPDEAIHLASAMQFAGFRSIIGTMGHVDKSVAPKIASTFYENMVDDSGGLDHTRAAFALNKTMNGLEDIPLGQRIQYIHIGA